MPAPHGLRNRIVFAFVGFSVLMSGIFAIFSFFLAYSIEDALFDKLLDDEVAYLNRHKDAAARYPFMQLYPGVDALPQALATAVREQAGRKEVYGAQGRHYHIRQLKQGVGSAYLVAEVSDYLAVRQARDDIVQLLIGMGLFILVLGILIGAALARRATRPLSRLAQQVAELDIERGAAELGKDYPNNEIGFLAEKIASTSQSLIDMLEREKRFTRDVSHELRTPLSILKNHFLLADKMQGSVLSSQQLSRTVQGMEQTVTTLLALAREESLIQHQVHLMPVLEQSIVKVSQAIPRADLELAISIDDAIAYPVNTQLLSILLDNLIGNTFLYARGGAVNIRGTEEGFWIENSRELVVKAHQSQGLGLGLNLAQRICERCGWSMKVDMSEQHVRVDVYCASPGNEKTQGEQHLANFRETDPGLT